MNSQFFSLEIILSGSGIKPRNLCSNTTPAHPNEQANVETTPFTCWIKGLFFFLKAEFTQSLKVEMHSPNSVFFFFKAFLLTTTKKSKCCLSFLIFCVFYKINMETIPTKLWVKFQSHLSWNITIKKSSMKKSQEWKSTVKQQRTITNKLI